MRFTPVGLDGAFLVEIDPVSDERGFFARTWCRDEFAEQGLDTELAQCSISRNVRAGTLRGMHWQQPPDEEVKLVRCTQGVIFDVIVDLRPDSSTRTRWFGTELDAEQATALYIPKGFAHGFQTLSDDAEILYLISKPYAPASARGFRWDDPTFAIDWPETATRTLSDRDRNWPDFGRD